MERDIMFKLHTASLRAARPTPSAWHDASTERDLRLEGLVFVGIMAYLATGLLSALGLF
jgi:hypothetical protein